MSDLQFQTCVTPEEKEAAKQFRQKHFFDCNRNSMRDPYVWTFDTPGHGHFALYDGKRMVGYAHIQYWPNHRAALRIIVVHEKERGRGVGAYLLKCCEEALKQEGMRYCQKLCFGQ
jgi:GNAT superfamily N-acetyltransferase